MRGPSPIARVGTRSDDFAPVGTGGGVGARNADVDDAAASPSGTDVRAACFCVVSFDGSVIGCAGGTEVRGSSAISFASSVGIETRSPAGLTADADVSDPFATVADSLAEGVAFDSLAFGSVDGAVAFVSLAGALDATPSVFASVDGTGAIGFAFATGAAAFIGNVRPRSGEPMVAGAGVVPFVDPAGAIGRAPGNGGENFEGVGRCGDGPGFAADGTFAKIGSGDPEAFEAGLFEGAGPEGAADFVDDVAAAGESFSTFFSAAFSGSDGSPIPSR